METVIGAALGAVFGELMKALIELKRKGVMFKETLDNLESTLESIAPLIKEIEQHNDKLGRPKEELKSLKTTMENGTKLVCKCLEIRKLDKITRIRYQGKLEAFEHSLMRFFIIDMQAQLARDQKETLLRIQRLQSFVNNLPFNTAAASNTEPGDLNESKLEYHEQQVKLESMDSSFLQEHMQNQQPPSTTTVIGPQYYTPIPILLEIVRTVNGSGSDEFNVINVEGKTIFNLKRPSIKSKRYTLFDNDKTPIITLHKKRMTAHKRWEIFRGESEEDLMFSVKQHRIIQLKAKLDVFLAKNTEENVCDFMVNGSWSGGSYDVSSVSSNNLIARIAKYVANGGFGSYKESVVVRLKANVDYAFIVALVIVILCQRRF